MDKLSWGAAQVEFLAGDEPVVVLPRVSMPVLHCLGGDIGPLVPAVPVSVPLWLALVLRQRQWCSIQPPNWLTEPALQSLLDAERASPDGFAAMPTPHYHEIALTLLNEYAERSNLNHRASSDVVAGDAAEDRLRALLEDLWATRQNKLRTGLLSLPHAEGATTVQLNNVCKLEMAIVRGFTVKALMQAHRSDVPFTSTMK